MKNKRSNLNIIKIFSWLFIAFGFVTVVIGVFAGSIFFQKAALLLSPDRYIENPSLHRLIENAGIIFLVTGLILTCTGAFLQKIHRAFMIAIEKICINNQNWLPTIIIISFILRLVWILLVHNAPVTDGTWFWSQSVNISEGKGVVDPNGYPTAYWPVGYSAFNGLLFYIFGPSLMLIKFINVIWGILTCILTYFIAKEVFNENTARIASLIIAIFPSQIIFTGGMCLTEVLFTFLLLLALFLYLKEIGESNFKNWKLPAVGIVFGLSSLVRPITLLAPFLVMFGYLFVKRRFWYSLGKSFIVALSMILVLAPWLIRNYRVFHEFVPVSTNAGINLYMGNNPYAKGRNILPPTKQVKEVEVVEDELQRDKMYRKMAFDFIVHNPIQFVLNIPKKMFYFYALDWIGVTLTLQGLENPSIAFGAVIALLSQFYYMIVLFLAICGIIHIYSNRMFGYKKGILMLIIVYFTIIYGVVFYPGQGKYHFPIIPLLSMFAAYYCSNRWVTSKDKPL